MGLGQLQDNLLYWFGQVVGLRCQDKSSNVLALELKIGVFHCQGYLQYTWLQIGKL